MESWDNYTKINIGAGACGIRLFPKLIRFPSSPNLTSFPKKNSKQNFISCWFRIFLNSLLFCRLLGKMKYLSGETLTQLTIHARPQFWRSFRKRTKMGGVLPPHTPQLEGPTTKIEPMEQGFANVSIMTWTGPCGCCCTWNCF